jgi:hypothetical protein
MKIPYVKVLITCANCQRFSVKRKKDLRKRLIKDGWQIKGRIYTCPPCAKIEKRLLKNKEQSMKKLFNSLTISETMQLVLTTATSCWCGDKGTLKALRAKRLMTKAGEVTKQGRKLAKYIWRSV